jgi:hypothetical protein
VSFPAQLFGHALATFNVVTNSVMHATRADERIFLFHNRFAASGRLARIAPHQDDYDNARDHQILRNPVLRFAAPEEMLIRFRDQTFNHRPQDIRPPPRERSDHSRRFCKIA